MNAVRIGNRRDGYLALGVALALFGADAAGAQTPPPPEAEPSPPALNPPPEGAEPAEAEPAPPVVAAPVAPAPAVVELLPPPEPDDEKDGKKKKKKKKPKDVSAIVLGDAERTGTLELNGRVFVRAELARHEAGQDDVDSFDLSVPSARFTATYRAPARWLSMQIEMEFAGNPDLRDGFIQAKSKHFVARAGQFKMPVSVIEMESPWTLPVARRGFLNDLLLDYLDVAGRRPGVLVGWRGGGELKPALSLGAFQGVVVTDQALNDRETDLIEEQSLEAQNLVARGELRLGPADFGAFYQHRVGSPGLFETDRYWTAGADLLIDEPVPGGGVRLWADAIFGASWYEHEDKVEDGDDAVFGSGRVIGAVRFGGSAVEAFYVEPYVMAGLLDPDFDVERDFATELALGVNVGLWRRARVSLEAELWQGDANFPHASQGLLYGAEPDRLAILAQAGAVF